MKCLKCNKSIPEDARLCPYCGTPVTGQQFITEKVYRDVSNNLKQFILQSPMDMTKAKVIDWSKDEIESKPKKPKAFYLIIFTMIITLSVIIVLSSFGMFK